MVIKYHGSHQVLRNIHQSSYLLFEVPRNTYLHNLLPDKTAALFDLFFLLVSTYQPPKSTWFSDEMNSLIIWLLVSLVQNVTSHPAGCQSRSSGGAVYLITNSQSNSVVSLRMQSNGMLSAGSSTSTGGAGSNGIIGSTNQPAVPDALFSQSALTVAGNVCNLQRTELEI